MNFVRGWILIVYHKNIFLHLIVDISNVYHLDHQFFVHLDPGLIFIETCKLVATLKLQSSIRFIKL